MIEFNEIKLNEFPAGWPAPRRNPIISFKEKCWIEGGLFDGWSCSPCLVFGWVMGAPAPMAPPKKRQTARERAAEFNQTKPFKESEIKPINLNDFVELMERREINETKHELIGFD